MTRTVGLLVLSVAASLTIFLPGSSSWQCPISLSSNSAATARSRYRANAYAYTFAPPGRRSLPTLEWNDGGGGVGAVPRQRTILRPTVSGGVLNGRTGLSILSLSKPSSFADKNGDDDSGGGGGDDNGKDGRADRKMESTSSNSNSNSNSNSKSNSNPKSNSNSDDRRKKRSRARMMKRSKTRPRSNDDDGGGRSVQSPPPRSPPVLPTLRKIKGRFDTNNDRGNIINGDDDDEGGKKIDNTRTDTKLPSNIPNRAGENRRTSLLPPPIAPRTSQNDTPDKIDSTKHDDDDDNDSGGGITLQQRKKHRKRRQQQQRRRRRRDASLLEGRKLSSPISWGDFVTGKGDEGKTNGDPLPDAAATAGGSNRRSGGGTSRGGDVGVEGRGASPSSGVPKKVAGGTRSPLLPGNSPWKNHRDGAAGVKLGGNGNGNGGDDGTRSQAFKTSVLPGGRSRKGRDLLVPPASPYRSRKATDRDLASSSSRSRSSSSKYSDTNGGGSESPPSSPQSTPPSLDGVLPVSELFYRSTPLQPSDQNAESSPSTGPQPGTTTTSSTTAKAKSDKGKSTNPVQTTTPATLDGDGTRAGTTRRRTDGTNADGAQYRTELAKMRASGTSGARVRPTERKGDRRRSAATTTTDNNNGDAPPSLSKRPGARRKKRKGRKLIRRGMEMLVGGESINADPPLRSVELRYNLSSSEEGKEEGGTPAPASDGGGTAGEVEDWATVITSNSREFGPLLHAPSVGKVTDLSRGLYCEHFVTSSIKWKVCPKDLDDLVRGHRGEDDDDGAEGTTPSSASASSSTINNTTDPPSKPNDTTKEGFVQTTTQKPPDRKQDDTSLVSPSTFHTADGWSIENKSRWKPQESYTLGGELKFSLGVPLADLSRPSSPSTPAILRRVLQNGVREAIRADYLGFDVAINDLVLEEGPRAEGTGGTTRFTVEFGLVPKEKMGYGEVERAAKRINIALARATDNGDIAVAMGAAAKKEDGWNKDVRDRVVEEFLFGAETDGEEEEGEEEEEEEEEANGGDAAIDNMDDFDTLREVATLPEKTLILPDQEEYDGPFGMPGDIVYPDDDLFLGGGNGGVFHNYSPPAAPNAPFEGTLGPILLDAVVERAKQRRPRVIAIGDVHGCLDELQMLLRRCDYRPGDLVVFLGDLVSKGPDSLSVVQMAREIGAIGVRGNHDFEVVRWHQAIKSGADPPVIGSEHYRIASSLSKADLKWMYNLPWYITSKELSALFVHAGFVSGIRLGKQNPRLMMNMRSILPDGTVTSKFFNNWPWARLWDGPKTVLFGHDADRGLQQYEHAIGLDTGCVYGGRLTACILPEKRLVSVNAKREYFHYRRKRFD